MLVHWVNCNRTILRKWLKDSSELDFLELPGPITERLRTFWSSRDQIFCLKLEDIGCDTYEGIVIAEKLVGRRHMFVFGAGHVGRSVALLGLLVGLEVTLIDDREEFLARDELVGYKTQVRFMDFTDIDFPLPLDGNAVVVIVTRGHQSDEIILKQVANYNPGYVGMIGSRRRVESVFRRLRGQGVSEAFLKRVKAPIGLDIGAKTPQEIAVAIHAEIIQHFCANS